MQNVDGKQACGLNSAGSFYRDVKKPDPGSGFLLCDRTDQRYFAPRPPDIAVKMPSPMKALAVT